MKITFKANKIYTSGTAIGIKYDKKIYNDWSSLAVLLIFPA